jgi:hypothetical protein
VLWKIGGVHSGKSLTILGDPQVAYPLGGQHDARFLPDGTLAGYAPGGARTFKLDFGGVFTYRANPVPRTVTTPALRSGMDAQYPR